MAYRTFGSIYFFAAYRVTDVSCLESTNWRVCSVNWRTNYDDAHYLLYCAAEGGQMYVKPFKHYDKPEYKRLFGASPCDQVALDRIVLLEGDGFECNLHDDFFSIL